jgi:shikimate kinase
MNRRIILIGYMGAGKTTLGRQLAAELGLPFIDSDAEIEKREGRSVKDIFEVEGELSFRSKETLFLKEVANNREFVLAVGGGTPCFFNNMDLLNHMGLTIYLDCSQEILIDRIGKEAFKRPLLKGLSMVDLEQFIAVNLKNRTPYYRQAKMVVSTEDQRVDALVRNLNEYKY